MNPPGDLQRRRWLVLASAMVSFFAVGMTFFAVPPLVEALRSTFALSNLAIGVLMGAIAAPAVVLSLPLGAAVDRWDPRTAGLAGLTVMLVGALVFAAAPSYAWLLGGRLLFGIGGLLVNLLLARLLSTAFAGRELALAMGLFTATYPASMIVLFSLHPLIAAHLGWRGELGVLAGLVVLALPLHLVAVPRGAVAVAAPGEGTRGLPAALVALGIAWCAYFAAFAPVPTFAPEWAGGGAHGLLVTSIVTWVALVASPIAGALIDRSGVPHRFVVGGLLVLAATLALMAADRLPTMLAMALVGLVAATVPPAVYAMPARLVTAQRAGFAFGFITLMSNLGTLAGPALAGAIRDATPAWPMVWGSLALLAAAAIAPAILARPPAAVTPGSSPSPS